MDFQIFCSILKSNWILLESSTNNWMEWWLILQMHINLLKYASGEYKQPTGIDITTDLCTAFEDDVLLGPILEINGMTSDDCPLEPVNIFTPFRIIRLWGPIFWLQGSLAIDHYTPKQDLFPDSFPEGKYQMLMEMSNQGEDLFKAKLYLYVEEV